MYFSDPARYKYFYDYGNFLKQFHLTAKSSYALVLREGCIRSWAEACDVRLVG